MDSEEYSRTATTSYNKDDTFWDKYLKGRPKAPDSLFERIIEYHKKHGGQFDTFHDCGAGPGLHTSRIKGFKKTIVTDISAQNIDVAKKHLKDCDFEVIEMEDTGKYCDVDLILCANMIHFCDPIKAMNAASSQLKSGGTFAMANFAVAVLEDPKVEEIWRKLYQAMLRSMMSVDGALREESLIHLRMSTSGFDMLGVPEDKFRDIERIKVNHHDGWSWFRSIAPPEFHEAIGRESRIGTSEAQLYETDAGWDFETDIHGLKDQLDTFPMFDLEKGEFKTLWNELRDVVGDRKIKGTVPLILLLASRQ